MVPYGGGLEGMLTHIVPCDPFEDDHSGSDDDDDDGDDHLEDNMGRNDVLTNDDAAMDGNVEDVDIQHHLESNANQIIGNAEEDIREPSTTGILYTIRDLVEDAICEAIAGGEDVLHHLKTMMSTVASDIRRIRILKEDNISHPQAASEIIYMNDGNSVARRKDFRERLSGSWKRRRSNTQ